MILFTKTKGDQELKPLLCSLDGVKSEFDGAADVITQMHKHFVTDDELKYAKFISQSQTVIVDYLQ